VGDRQQTLDADGHCRRPPPRRIRPLLQRKGPQGGIERRALIHRLARFWSRDVSLGVFLALLIAIVFFLLPLAHYQYVVGLLANVALSLLLLSGGLVVLARGWVRLLIILVALSTIFVRWAGTVAGGDTLLLTGTGLMVVSLALLLALFLAAVYRAGSITVYRILGAIAAYGLLGLVWAYVYLLLELTAPGALQFPAPAPALLSLERIQADVVYFSFATLTTLGYGDIVPVHAFARSMAVLEALTGQLFLATLIARLVSQRAGPD
jgi:hypothetical protein